MLFCRDFCGILVKNCDKQINTWKINHKFIEFLQKVYKCDELKLCFIIDHVDLLEFNIKKRNIPWNHHVLYTAFNYESKNIIDRYIELNGHYKLCSDDPEFPKKTFVLQWMVDCNKLELIKWYTTKYAKYIKKLRENTKRNIYIRILFKMDNCLMYIKAIESILKSKNVMFEHYKSMMYMECSYQIIEKIHFKTTNYEGDINIIYPHKSTRSRNAWRRTDIYRTNNPDHKDPTKLFDIKELVDYPEYIRCDTKPTDSDLIKIKILEYLINFGINISILDLDQFTSNVEYRNFILPRLLFGSFYTTPDMYNLLNDADKTWYFSKKTVLAKYEDLFHIKSIC